MTEKELFEEWWENEGQYHRAGGDEYCKTFAYHAWQASVNREGFVLVPLAKETAVAIEQKVEQQLEASGITADPFRLDGWVILDAISAVEVQNGLD